MEGQQVYHPGTEREISPPALTALGFLALGRGRGGGDDLAVERHGRNGDESRIAPVPTSWAVMMAAMMLPSALPLVYEFARRSERRRGWQAATGLHAVAYLSLWLWFGLACYVVLNAFPVPPADQDLVGGVALALAGPYGLTPIKAASQARCRELCSLHGPLAFSLVRSALIVGARYGLSCVGCSAGLMVAMAIVGMSNLGWMLVLAGGVLVYKLAPVPSRRRTWLLSAALIGMGLACASIA